MTLGTCGARGDASHARPADERPPTSRNILRDTTTTIFGVRVTERYYQRPAVTRHGRNGITSRGLGSLNIEDGAESQQLALPGSRATQRPPSCDLIIASNWREP